jgi:hypothetical protein
MTPLPHDYTRCQPELPGQQCDKCRRYARHPMQTWGPRTPVLHGVEAPGEAGCDYIPEVEHGQE